MNVDSFLHAAIAHALCVTGATSVLASDPWLVLVNETDQRLVAADSFGKQDSQERDYAWGDLNNNGWIDLVAARKQPFTTAGKRINLLFMNENGVLVDRTAEYASAVAQDQLPDGVSDEGFLTPTNDRDIAIAEFTADGWLDMVTAVTISDGDPKHIGHPRVYINLGNDGSGNWQGFRFEDACIPTMCSKAGVCPPTTNPRFASVSAGDLTNNGVADLYFADHGNAPGAPMQPPEHDFDNRLLINDGNGFFTDESLTAMGATFNYGGNVGEQNYLVSAMGLSSAIADINGNGLNDVVKQSSLQLPAHVAIKYNDPENIGQFINYQIAAPVGDYGYYVSVGDLNNNGRPDLVIASAFTDLFRLNLATNPDGAVQWSDTINLPGPSGFASNVVIVDLDNSGWNDIIIADVDADVPGCSRFTQIYRNRMVPAPNADFLNESDIIPASERQGVFDIAAFDLTGNGWMDLVLARCSGTGVWVNVPPTQPCPADLTGTGMVNVFDLLELLAAWGPTPGSGHPADLNGDGVVNVFDLLELLAQWGPCP